MRINSQKTGSVKHPRGIDAKLQYSSKAVYIFESFIPAVQRVSQNKGVEFTKPLRKQ